VERIEKDIQKPTKALKTKTELKLHRRLQQVVAGKDNLSRCRVDSNDIKRRLNALRYSKSYDSTILNSAHELIVPAPNEIYFIRNRNHCVFAFIRESSLSLCLCQIPCFVDDESKGYDRYQVFQLSGLSSFKHETELIPPR
jgi:hypothetical protein